MRTALKLELSVRRNREPVRFSFSKRLWGEEKVIHYALDTTHSDTVTWDADKPTQVELTLDKGTHTLAIDVDGVLPCSTVRLPEQTVALTDELPLLVDPVTGKPSRKAALWNPAYPPVGLAQISEALFMRNAQLMDLTETFARLPNLKSVPKLVFLPLSHARIFTGLFKNSALETVDAALFSAAVNATDFREVFYGCRALKSVPETLFDANTKAWRFDRAFEKSGLTSIPSALFAHVLHGASFARTFAHCPLKSVPEGLLTGLNPTDVDGMFEPEETLPHDPLKIKAAPRFPASFFTDIRMARGIPTLSRTR